MKYPNYDKQNSRIFSISYGFQKLHRLLAENRHRAVLLSTVSPKFQHVFSFRAVRRCKNVFVYVFLLFLVGCNHVSLEIPSVRQTRNTYETKEEVKGERRVWGSLSRSRNGRRLIKKFSADGNSAAFCSFIVLSFLPSFTIISTMLYRKTAKFLVVCLSTRLGSLHG